jgi:C4-dicarboxylate transporter DctM subunit
MGLSMMLLCSVIAWRRGYPVSGEPFSFARAFIAFRKAALVFGMPVVVIGGIVAGAFTPTEGAAIAVVYAMAIGFFVTRKLKVADIAPALLGAGIVTSVVGALIAFSATVTYLLTLERVGDLVGAAIVSFTSDATVFLLLVMGVLLILGMFMEGNTIIIMFTPIVAPVAATFGIDPVFFGLLFVTNVVLGSITPPVGILLFVTASIWRIDLMSIAREVVPFIVLLYAVLLVLVLVPELSMWLPRQLGY